MQIQDDTRPSLWGAVRRALADTTPESEQYYELIMLSDALQGHVGFYAGILTDHGLDLPFHLLQYDD